ncbi:hypothetical protein NL676_030975 [Syzygium grande]|nr:hypothetical protein NL676_030975 [Syzygium grande]
MENHAIDHPSVHPAVRCRLLVSVSRTQYVWGRSWQPSKAAAGLLVSVSRTQYVWGHSWQPSKAAAGGLVWDEHGKRLSLDHKEYVLYLRSKCGGILGHVAGIN